MIRWAHIKDDTFVAVEEGNYDFVLKMIKEYPKLLKIYNVSGETLLHEAAKFNNIPIMKLLVEKGMDVDILIKNGKCTPIGRAVENGSIEAVHWLIEHGANVNEGRGVHATPLIDAAFEGNLEIVKLLIESGADVNGEYCMGEGTNKTRMNALRFAQMKGHNKVAEFLKSNGAKEIDPNEKLGEDNTHDREEELKKHIEKHLGRIENTLGEVVPGSKVSVNVNIIEPSEGKDYITLVTTGMSDCSMNPSADEEQYAELLIKLPADWPISKEDLKDENNYWPFGWLRQMAHIPHLYDGWINEGVIIPNGEPPKPFSPKTELSCLVVCRPTEEELGIYKSSDGSIINFYTIIPIYDDERYIAMRRGVPYLLKLLKKRGVEDILDINRKNICS